jgi:uncharacterized phage-like protein YoqJ
MKEKTCCFTGHRHIPSEYLPAISKTLRDTLIFYIEQGYQYFGAGGALGFDTIAARTVLSLKERYPDIKLILVLPCKDQASRWNASDVKEYERLKSHADKIVYIADRYYNGCMQKRNHHLVECSSLCICYLTEQTGGTKYTVDYASKSGCIIHNLAQKKQP